PRPTRRPAGVTGTERGRASAQPDWSGHRLSEGYFAGRGRYICRDGPSGLGDLIYTLSGIELTPSGRLGQPISPESALFLGSAAPSSVTFYLFVRGYQRIKGAGNSVAALSQMNGLSGFGSDPRKPAVPACPS